VDREGLGVYDRLEQGVCIAWALFGNEFSVLVNHYSNIKMMHGPIRIRLMMTVSKFIQMKHGSDVSHKAQWNYIRIVYIYIYIHIFQR
jgi:hypothetical protein